MDIEREIVIKSGKLICPKSNGGCGENLFVVSIDSNVYQSRIYLDCIKCKYRMSILIDRYEFVEANTGPLDIRKK